jgi:hypothetical protein
MLHKMTGIEKYLSMKRIASLFASEHIGHHELFRALPNFSPDFLPRNRIILMAHLCAMQASSADYRISRHKNKIKHTDHLFSIRKLTWNTRVVAVRQIF